jgi:chaperonin cofactor prefoldin
MPDGIVSNNHGYDAELDSAYEEQPAGKIAVVDSLDENLPDILKTKEFRAKIESSKANKSAVMPFLAAVNVDLGRQKPAGLFNLFNAWLEFGNKYWLNPMDKEHGLGALAEILFKYQGGFQELTPFIQLLIQVARNGVSPRSFAEYVILPRMHDDYNWRKWQENHLEALQLIADSIYSIKDRPPFNHEHLGSGKMRLARDIVLVKYIGRPLAQFQLSSLSDSAMLEKYISVWQKIALKDTLVLYFIRCNALHFIYLMSGKIDLIQLIAIMEQLPVIEHLLSAVVHKGLFKNKNVDPICLYDYDIEDALYARRQRGFHNLDFVIEIKAYLRIMQSMLEKAAAVHLCTYYAGLLKRYKNPHLAKTIFGLVQIIHNRSGMHVYKWHTKKLLTIPTDQMQDYIDLVNANHGCDPEYPNIHILFRDEEQVRQDFEMENILTHLGLRQQLSAAGADKMSFKQALNAYIQEHPETESIVADYQRQLLEGSEYQWTADFIQQLDDISDSNKRLYLHLLLLRSVIRGIGTGYSLSRKSSSFTGLFTQYGGVKYQPKISVKTVFSMPIIPFFHSSADHDALARKEVNLVPVEKVWNVLCNTETLNTGNVLTYINKWSMELDKPLENAFDEKIELGKILEETSDENVTKETKKDIAKQEKTIDALQEKKQNYAAIMGEFDMLNDKQQFLLALILAGTAGRSDDEFTAYATGLLLQRYKDMNSISSRLNFLQDDISVDVLSYQQFDYLLNLLETLFFALREDQEIIELLEDDTILQKILGPYLITKKKEVTLDALDAAAKKMTGYAGMQAERAKWQGILNKMEQKDEKYFHNMEIYTSKTFMDSFYGDMGGICLSRYPEQILHPGFFVQRLTDTTEKQIVGMSILCLSNRGFNSPAVSAQNYFQAFAFNPLASLLKHFSEEQQFYLYLQFRLNMEKAALMTNMPVVLSGVDTPWGLISNNAYFGELIRNYEYGKATVQKVFNAKGLSIYYKKENYAVALVIIDPRGYEQIADPAQIPTFYAHRELQNLENLGL